MMRPDEFEASQVVHFSGYSFDGRSIISEYQGRFMAFDLVEQGFINVWPDRIFC